MSQSPNSQSARLEARLSPDVHALLKHAADLQGRSLTDFVVSAARDAAVRAIEETEIVRLTLDDQKRFVDLLIEPPPMTPAMERALARHRKLIDQN